MFLAAVMAWMEMDYNLKNLDSIFLAVSACLQKHISIIAAAVCSLFANYSYISLSMFKDNVAHRLSCLSLVIVG